MGVVIKAVFGKSGGRCDKKLPHDFNRAFDFLKRASELENEPDKFEIAKHLLEQAIEIDPEYILALVHLGTLFYTRKMFFSAKETWIKAWKLAKTEPTISYNLGTACLALGDIDEAILYLQKAIKLDPSHSNSYFNIAVAYEKVGLTMTAEKYWKKVLELNPNEPHCDFIKRRLLTVK